MVNKIQFISNETGKPVAEKTFSSMEAFVEKSENCSEILSVHSEFDANWVKFMCYSMDYDIDDAHSEIWNINRSNGWFSQVLVAFNSNKYNLKLKINGKSLFDKDFPWIEFER